MAIAAGASRHGSTREKIFGSLREDKDRGRNLGVVWTPRLKVVCGIDETWFREMVLVLMDLASGYLFVEEESNDKSYETWLEKAREAAKKYNLEFIFFVSDRARQLIKLATDGFGCPSIPDLFHAAMSLKSCSA